MLFLAAHIAGNATFSLLVKHARSRRYVYDVVGLTNYATACLVSALGMAFSGLGHVDVRAALFGVINGLQYQTTFLLMYVLIGMAGIAVTTGFLRLSVAVPVLASIVIWAEVPTRIQAIGLVLAAIALPLLGVTAHRGRAAQASSALPRGARAQVAGLVVLTVLVSGCGLLAAKAFAELGQPEQRPVYVLGVYAAATLASLLTWLTRSGPAGETPVAPRGSRRRSILLGMIVGAVNWFQIWALLPALAQVPGVIAFPVAAAGGLMLVTLGGWLIWHEPLGGRTGAGIALAAAGAALVNAR